MMARESRWTAPDEAAVGRLLDAADDAPMRGDLPAAAELRSLLVRPATDVQLLVPLERVLLSGDGLDMQLVHDRGASLAAVACALLPDDPASGIRLGVGGALPVRRDERTPADVHRAV